ncbi:hypothetical protein GPECTOR_13g688 [Gonium pectorale]|uniref:Protein kinase domain-containing protein n=1 Tax=Gonium pectorale TaxID=33097 RepID=A0A150GN33_GONPE|nr:hypothetical protein GPECTOR_13g688 [Gonium pectorale]|eukprot:KXZ51201.1 hypothetical protein GPECTOR_13g688 [Gonium pectorale]
MYVCIQQLPDSSTIVITPLTPPRADVPLDARPGNEVTLLPTVLGKGAFGRVVEGMYQGKPVAVKLLLDMSLDSWGLPDIPDKALASSNLMTTVDNLTTASYMAQLANGGIFPGELRGGGYGGGGQELAPEPDHVMGPTTAGLARALSQEVAVLSRCRHPNIVTLLAACLEPPRFCLVLERCETSLDKLLYGRPGELLPMEQVLSIALDVARSLEYLHPTVVHRDLKPA